VRSVTATAYARAGLLGNPSDIYGGRVLAFTFRNFAARVVVEPAERVELGTGVSADSLVDAVALGVAGRHGSNALLAAALKTLTDHAPRLLALPAGDPQLGCRVTVTTDIPRQVGLAGSSAIVVAALRALTRWFGVALDAAAVAELALRAERDELGITAGPMDRVVQAYGGLLYIDCRPPRSPGSYLSLDPGLLPPLFVAWDPALGASSGTLHDEVRARWERGDRGVQAVVEELATLADHGREALRARDVARLRRLVDRNFDVRASIWNLGPRDHELVAVGRRRGAAVKFCGSGGSVLGVMRDAAEYPALEEAYRAAGCAILQPEVVVG
jgi:glucuronokinase